MNHRQNIFPFNRALYWSTAALFLGFLVISTPHRVHHFFDQYQSSPDKHSGHHHPDGNRADSKNSLPNCVFQEAASRCHARVGAPVPIDAVALFIENLFLPIERAVLRFFLPGAFHIRAPPQSSASPIR